MKSTDSPAAAYEEGVISNAKWINRVLVSGASASATIVILKLFGARSFVWQGIEISTDASWALLLAFTVAHLYCCLLFLRSGYLLWSCSKGGSTTRTFLRITQSGGLFMRGLRPRRRSPSSLPGVSFYKMEAKDLTTHLSIASAVLVMAAVVPFSTQNLPKFIYGMAAGVALMALNWLIGSNWAVALSEMALPKGNAKYLATLNDAFHFDWGNPSDGCAVGIGYYLLPIIMLGLTWLVYRAAQVVIDAGLY